MWARQRTTCVAPAVPRGLSLIDVSITVAILGILAGIAVPRFLGMTTSLRVDAAARRIAADFGLARERAIAGSESQTVQFAADTASYSVPGISDFDRPQQIYSVDLSAPPYEVTIASRSFGVTHSVTFDIYGRPNRGGSVTVSAGGYQKSVAVDATTGRATVP